MCYGCQLGKTDADGTMRYLDLLQDLKRVQWLIKNLNKDVLAFEKDLPDGERQRFHKARSHLKRVCAEVGRTEDIWSTPVLAPLHGGESEKVPRYTDQERKEL